MIKRIVAFVLVFVVVVAIHLFWLSTFNATESYPADAFLDQVENKTALVIVAHDDDAISSAGTVDALVDKGWEVHFLAFYGNHTLEMNDIRKGEVARVAEIQDLASTQLIDFSMAKWDSVKEPWMPIPYDKWPAYFKIDSLKMFIAQAIDKHRPSVIFTLDNIMGGYGHSEHACVSQCILDVCAEKKADEFCSVQKVYQAIFTPSMNEKIIGDLPVFNAAIKVYNIAQVPVPSVEITIRQDAAEKTAVMRAYKSQHKNLKKFWPFYNWYPAEVYWSIFDKEYFRVISI